MGIEIGDREAQKTGEQILFDLCHYRETELGHLDGSCIAQKARGEHQKEIEAGVA